MPAYDPEDAEPRERALLARVCQRDRTALESLYRAYHGRLQRFLTRLSHRRDLVDEVINDTFWIVWQKAADFQGASRVSTWIMGITYRCLLKALRQHPSLPGLSEVDEAAELPTSDDTLQREEREQWLRRGLAMLSFEQRQTLLLAYYLGHSLEEIAEIVQCPVSTVKARMFHARTKLRTLLPALGGFDIAEQGS